ncbi:MBL fold metallo-hydrolase [Aurantiacibacter spongiae]|nr:MBL fold metallo-hydrolase [Aurantiacibacter spongiae]
MSAQSGAPGRWACLSLFAIALGLSSCVAPQGPPQKVSSAVVDRARDLAATPADWAAACGDWDDWDQRAPAFRVFGNTYHVGTCGISALLVAGPEGHVLIDTGTRQGSVGVLENIRNLGFAPENVVAVLTSHEHFDHVGGLWWVNRNTGARVVTSPKAAPVLASGQASPDDPQSGRNPPMRAIPADLIDTVTPGHPVTLAGMAFTPIASPGHTSGALSWQWESCEGSDCRTIVFADSLTPVSRDDYRFADHPAYLRAYRDSIARIAALECDILLTPHPSASRMRDKALAGEFASEPKCGRYAQTVLGQLQTRLTGEARE